MVCTVISIPWFFPFSVWLLLCDGVLLRGLLSLRIIFNCSPDVISRSFVSTDFAVLVFFSDWMFLISWFEWIFLISSLYLINGFSKRFITVFSFFNSSCRKKKLFAGIASLVFPSVFVACFCRKSILKCETSAMNYCLRELDCSFRLHVKLSSCNWKVAKSFMLLFCCHV